MVARLIRTADKLQVRAGLNVVEISSEPILQGVALIEEELILRLEIHLLRDLLLHLQNRGVSRRSLDHHPPRPPVPLLARARAQLGDHNGEVDGIHASWSPLGASECSPCHVLRDPMKHREGDLRGPVGQCQLAADLISSAVDTVLCEGARVLESSAKE